MRIDLHTHSTASDGTLSPAEIIVAAGAAGLDVVALTDHDSTAGWDEAVAALSSGGPAVRLVRGMEMSTIARGEDGRPVPVHLLAYLFDPAHEAFAAERRRLRAERGTRLRTMAERMAADGLPVDADEIMAAAGPSAGRPHLARALLEAGVVVSIGEAFESILAPSSPYYLDKADTDIADAITLIDRAGGVSVLAHPLARARGRLIDLDHVRELAAPARLGGTLAGIEVDHPDHNSADRSALRELASELGLITTGSSDFHGENKSTRLGENTTCPDQYAALVGQATGISVLGGRDGDGAA
ncbi:PHP domain-containing protein [Tomitella biformata]|uniref:PHP domain-containing protein n=1 Tax=Tomitella biformata TaxID=630403 RepID=UPI000466A979|nr:PHP domain-containing protein [Tomitella biformata]